MKKFLSTVLAVLLVLSMSAFAESDLQTQLDEANAKIEELQALVDKYEPYYTSSLAATYGEDGIITVDEVLEQYNEMAEYYAQMGLDLEAYGMDVDMKKDIVTTLLQNAVLLAKAKELGLDQLTEEQESEIRQTVDDAIESYITSYTDYFYPDQEVTEDMRTEATEYWTENGLDSASMYDSQVESAILDLVEDYITKDIAITEEDTVATYDSMVAEDEENYTNDPSAFVNAWSDGDTIAWIPEGHRAVKQVLIRFDDDQSSRYSDLTSQLSSLKSELEEVENPTEDTTEESAEETDTEDAEATPEPTAEPRTVEEINADIDNVNAQIDALYEELMPEVNEVIDAFNNGTAIDELIEKYNDDPGMTTEPTATKGYAVAEGSTNWDSSFTEAAMSIQNIGEMSEPARGSYGIYMVYYLDDIAPGAVDMETIRDAVEEKALTDKQTEAYDNQLATWLEESNATYYYENLGITA